MNSFIFSCLKLWPIKFSYILSFKQNVLRFKITAKKIKKNFFFNIKLDYFDHCIICLTNLTILHTYIFFFFKKIKKIIIRLEN